MGIFSSPFSLSAHLQDRFKSSQNCQDAAGKIETENKIGNTLSASSFFFFAQNSSCVKFILHIKTRCTKPLVFVGFLSNARNIFKARVLVDDLTVYLFH